MSVAVDFSVRVRAPGRRKILAPVVQAALTRAAPVAAAGSTGTGAFCAVAAEEMEPNAGVQQLAAGGTLVLRRMARLLPGAGDPATEVTELKNRDAVGPDRQCCQQHAQRRRRIG